MVDSEIYDQIFKPYLLFIRGVKNNEKSEYINYMCKELIKYNYYNNTLEIKIENKSYFYHRHDNAEIYNQSYGYKIDNIAFCVLRYLKKNIQIGDKHYFFDDLVECADIIRNKPVNDLSFPFIFSGCGYQFVFNKDDYYSFVIKHNDECYANFGYEAETKSVHIEKLESMCENKACGSGMTLLMLLETIFIVGDFDFITLIDQSSKTKENILDKNMSYYEIHGYFPILLGGVTNDFKQIDDAVSFNRKLVCGYEKKNIKKNNEVTKYITEVKDKYTVVTDNVDDHLKKISNIVDKLKNFYKLPYFHYLLFVGKSNKNKEFINEMREIIERSHVRDGELKICVLKIINEGNDMSKLRLIYNFFAPFFSCNEVVDKINEMKKYDAELVKEIMKYRTPDDKMIDDNLFFLQKGSLISQMIKYIRLKDDDAMLRKYKKYKTKYLNYKHTNNINE